MMFSHGTMNMPREFERPTAKHDQHCNAILDVTARLKTMTIHVSKATMIIETADLHGAFRPQGQTLYQRSTALAQRHSGSSVRFPKPRAQAQSASNQFQASPPSGSSRIQTVYRESLSAHRGTCAASPCPQVPLPPMGLGFSEPAMPTSRQLSPIQDRPCRWTTTSPACPHGYPSWLRKAYTTREARSASFRADVC